MAYHINPLHRVWMDAALRERPTKESIKQRYLGDQFFPLKRVFSYELTWDIIKASNPLAGIYAHDGVAIPGSDPSFSQKIADIMHIMASRTLSQDIVMKVRDAGELSVFNALTRSLRAKYQSHVTKKLGSCQDEVEGTMEYLRMKALQGSIPWPPTAEDGSAISDAPASWGDVSFTLSMGFGASYIQNASTLTGVSGGLTAANVPWSTIATADPIRDLEVISQFIEEDTGVDPMGATLLCSRHLLSYLSQNAAILKWIRGVNGPAIESTQAFINTDTLKSAIQTRLGYTIKTYDARWTYVSSGKGSEAGETTTLVRFLPKDKLIIIPQGVITPGENAFFATAPDLIAKNGENLGPFTWSHTEEVPPGRTELGVGIHGFPILKDPKGLFVLDWNS
jgi:hypothetical protein